MKQILTEVVGSINYLPVHFRNIFDVMRKQLQAKWPNDSQVIYTGMTFWIRQ